MKKIDKSFKNQQEIFAWLAIENNKVKFKDGDIYGCCGGRLYNFSRRINEYMWFDTPSAWEKVLPLSWEDFLEEYDVLCFVDDNGSPNINRSPCYLVVDRGEKAFKDAYQLFWNCATPLDINDFIILDNKYIARRKPCSTE